MRLPAPTFLAIALLVAAAPAAAMRADDRLSEYQPLAFADESQDLGATQGGGKSLSEAIEQVRRQTGGQILSAQTKVSGNREVHHIKVLTQDGKVKTVKVQGRRIEG